jgi:DNA polymerase IV
MNQGASMRTRTILHLRLDHLPSAVAAQAEPDLAVRPHVVAFGQPGARVLDASPQAEARGIRRGMSVWEAQAMSPGLEVVPPDPEGTHAAHGRAVEAALRFTPQVLPLSLSELVLDVTGSLRLFGGQEALCAAAQEGLLDACGAWATAGLGPNPLVARMATELAAPGAVCDMTTAILPEALAQLPLAMLLNVDERKRARLAAMGVQTLGQLRLIPSLLLRREFGEAGELIYQAARGQDATVVPVYEAGDPALVVRHRTELPRPTREGTVLRVTGMALAGAVATSLRMRGQSARELRLAVMLWDRATVERRRALPAASNTESALRAPVEDMLETVALGARLCVAVELTAMDLQAGSAAHQLSLFDSTTLRQAHLEEVRDRLAGRDRSLAALPASQVDTAA